ncbi:MAG TPA: DAK2 domain-containing protein, partial [Spirochaetia bacterium]|nr:DAK2 domain-containing protein [Spirochaetia bacterium]
MESFSNQYGSTVVQKVIDAVRDHAALLSEIDGAIGDGDHGINMAKGFGLAAERIGGRPISLTEGLTTISSVLLTEIGGAMGP